MNAGEKHTGTLDPPFAAEQEDALISQGVRLGVQCDEATAEALRHLLRGHPGVRIWELPKSAGAGEVQWESAAQLVEKRPDWAGWCASRESLTVPVTEEPRRQEDLQVHTDGSCQGQGEISSRGPTGMAVIVHSDAGVLASYGWGGGEGTNNTAELCAAIGALNLAATRRSRSVTITTDSEYVCKNAENWKPDWASGRPRPVKNQEFWNAFMTQRLALEALGVEVKLNWIKGHKGHSMNERADSLAKTACREQSFIRKISGINR